MTLVARSGALSDIGLHRKTNEDTYVVAPPLFAVCDGMGGAQAGEVASGLAAETLASRVAEGGSLLAAAEAANAAVFARAGADTEHTGMGTTLTAVVVDGDIGHFVHIGDSRAYLLREDVLRQVSDDHSLVGEMVRDGRLTEEEAASHPHRSILSRALGTEATARIDEFVVELLAGDVLLLCSDGLSGVVTAENIAKALGRPDPADAAKKLIAEARKNGGPDNITAVVLRLDEPRTMVAPAPEEDVTLAIAADEATTGIVAAVPAAGVAPAAVEAAPGGAAPPDSAAPGDGDTDDAAGAEEPAEAPADDEAVTAVAPVAEEPADATSGATADGSVAPVSPKPGRRLGCFAVALAILVVVSLAGALTISTVYYVGVDQGRLAIYSGLPVEVGPVHLHAVYRRSQVLYSDLSPSLRQLVDEQSLHTRGGASALGSALGMSP